MAPPATGRSNSGSSSQTPTPRSNRTPSSNQSSTHTEGSVGNFSGTNRSVGNSTANSTSPTTHIDMDAQANNNGDGQAQRTNQASLPLQRYENQDALQGPFPESSVPLSRRYSALHAMAQHVDDVFKRH